jgi:hypothetical protein
MAEGRLPTKTLASWGSFGRSLCPAGPGRADGCASWGVAVDGEDNSVCGMDGDAGTRESKRVPHRRGLVSTDFFGMLSLALWM